MELHDQRSRLVTALSAFADTVRPVDIGAVPGVLCAVVIQHIDDFFNARRVVLLRCLFHPKKLQIMPFGLRFCVVCFLLQSVETLGDAVLVLLQILDVLLVVLCALL